nr:26S proteasome SU [Cryptomonas sp.]
MIYLFENVFGYSLIYCKYDYSKEINDPKFHDFFSIYKNFHNKFSLLAFAPFSSTENALQNIACISESNCNSCLSEFLIGNFKNYSKKTTLCVPDFKLAANIYVKTSIKTIANETTIELIRIIRTHFEKFSRNFVANDLMKAQCSIAHLFSQSKMKYNPHKNDNMVIQTSFLIEQLDNDINTFSMICREWYSWHFPELSKLVNDNYLYSLIVRFIGNRKNLRNRKLVELGIITLSCPLSNCILEKAKSSVGSSISTLDLLAIQKFSAQIIIMIEFRQKLLNYLKKKIKKIVPNLSVILGEIMSAKLISRSGSLKNLAKLPSSTIQLLGAEKALFRSLKSKSSTPKHGLLFNSYFVNMATSLNKGRVARYIANKCAMAIRIDYFSNFRTKLYGQTFKKQILNKIKNCS